MKQKKADFEKTIDPKELQEVFDQFPEIIKKKKAQARYRQRILKRFQAFSNELAKRIRDPK